MDADAYAGFTSPTSVAGVGVRGWLDRSSRNGAHPRQAASTRFQQSEQHTTPQFGHGCSETPADAKDSSSRRQRSQKRASSSTLHSTAAQPVRRAMS
jgi:hypothetical protein